MTAYKFDVQISTNFGYVFTQEAVQNVIKSYEIANISSFVHQTTRKSNIGDEHNKFKVYWEDVTRSPLKVEESKIKFDGIPYHNISTKRYECHHGKDWKAEYKAEKRAANKQMPADVHGYVQKKSRRCIQATKKLDCPALLIVREVVKFPEFKIMENTARRRRDASAALKKENKTRQERRFYIYLPTEDDHKGTHIMGEDDSDFQQLDPSVIKKIEDVVSSYEIRTPSEMELILKYFVQNEINLQPAPSEDDRRFYPNKNDIRFHMNKAEKALRKHKNDQENLEKLIDEWKDTAEEQEFFFRKLQEDNEGEEEESTLLFVHQTAWQKKLLMKYGQEICLLDATYKTVRYALPLFFIAVKSNTGYIVVATFITQDEKTTSIKEALDIVKQWCPGWSPKFFMTDCADQEINAVEQVFQGCDVLICDFHRAQAWERWTNRLENGLRPIRKEVLAKLNRIAHAVSVPEYTEAVESLKSSSIWNANKNLQKWFEREWLSIHKRWVCAFRLERFLLSVNTNNGIERQNRAFKDEYVRKKYKLSLSKMVQILVEDFLPDSWKKYRKNNLKASSQTRKYSNDVPAYLHNRPLSVIKFCLNQLEESKSLAHSDVELCNNKVKVRSVSRPTESYCVDLCQPSCNCYTWRRNGLPCKHFFAVFAHTAAVWQDMPETYRKSPFLILDVAGAEVTDDNDNNYNDDDNSNNNIDDDDFSMMAENAGAMHNDDDSLDVDEELPCVNSKDSSNRLQQQCRETLREIREVTFLMHDTMALGELKDSLATCLRKVRQQVRQEDGLPLIPSPQKKAPQKRKSNNIGPIDPLQKLMRRRRPHPYTGRCGQKAMLMRTNLMTNTPIEAMSCPSTSRKGGTIAPCIQVQVEEIAAPVIVIDYEGSDDGGSDDEESDDDKDTEEEANQEDNEEVTGIEDVDRRSITKDHQKLYVQHGNNSKTAAPVIIIDDEGSDDGGSDDGGYEKWLEVEKIVLTSEDRDILTNNKWINDKLINAFQILLRRKYPRINGLQNSQMAKKLGFNARPPFVQVLHVSGNHWITVACLSRPYNTIKLYDSFNTTSLSTDIKEVLACLMSTTKDHFLVSVERMESQMDGSSCGLYALAYATDLCAKQRDPRETRYDTTNMRQHLMSCLESASISLFPTSGLTRRKVGTLVNIKVYCHCRLSWNKFKGVKMMECSHCFEWFHYPCCEEPPSSAASNKTAWYCKVCKPIVEAIKKGKWDAY